MFPECSYNNESYSKQQGNNIHFFFQIMNNYGIIIMEYYDLLFCWTLACECDILRTVSPIDLKFEIYHQFT